MAGVGDAGAAFLELHLRIEIIELPGEILDHEVDVGNLAPLFLGAETVQPEERFA